MAIFYSFLFLLVLINVVNSRDYVAGMFRKNDYLVSDDRVYKPRVPYRFNVAKYTRVFKCPITYFRVVDRLNMPGRGPKVQVIKGGIRQKFMVLQITGGYNLPISVNVYVGCENKQPVTVRTVATTTAAQSAATSSEKPAPPVATVSETPTPPGPAVGETTVADAAGGETTVADAEGNDTTAAPAPGVVDDSQNPQNPQNPAQPGGRRWFSLE